MHKSFRTRLAALERLEAAGGGEPSPSDQVDALQGDELLGAAIDAVWAGEIVFHGPADAQPAAHLRGILPQFVESFERAEAAARLCDRVNAVLRADNALLPLLPATDAPRWLEHFRSGDYFIHSVAGEPDMVLAPDYVIGERLRNAAGEVWNTCCGGELVWPGRCLLSWAAQVGEALTVDNVIRWLEAE